MTKKTIKQNSVISALQNLNGSAHKDEVKEWLEQNSDVEFLKENLGANWFYSIMWEVSTMRKEGKIAPTDNDGVWTI